MDNASIWNPATDVYLAWDNAAGDRPIAGDWNGDGFAETGVYRPGVGFYLKMDNASIWNPATDVYLAWDNAAGDRPIAGDWNGDGRSETGVYRPGVGFYLKMDNASIWNPATDVYLAWDNAAVDLPIAGDWNGDGRSETGVYRPGVGFYLKMDNGSTWNPVTDRYLVWDNANGDLPIAGPLTINRVPVAPVAAFTNTTPRSGTAPLTVMFTDQSTNAPTSWKWEYQAGSGSWTEFESGARNPSHEFASGTYDIRLTSSNIGGSDEETKAGYIMVNPAPVAPVAQFEANPTSGLSPLTVTFTDLSTNTPTSWQWEYRTGSGSWTEFGSGAWNPSHEFAAGTYDIRLTASNLGGSNNVTKTEYITVHEIPVAPEAGFIPNKRSGTAPLMVRFIDQSTGTEPLTYEWDFDNNGSTDSTVQSPLFTYSSVGTYTVKLTVSNAVGSNSTTKANYITVTEGQPGQSHAGVAITFDDNSIENWYAIRSVLKTYNANVTFFVSNYATLGESEIGMLRTLQADGHEIGYHGYGHLDASIYLENHTISEYMSNEIINGVTLMQTDGFNPVDFSLPNGHGDDNSSLINALEQHFIHIRGTNGGSMYYQYGSNTPVIYAQGIDDITYGQSMDDIYNYISTAKENDEIVIFYCHDPVPSDPQDYQISYSRLQNILANASQNNMKFYTVSELP
jgi:PKD repeat protein